MKDSIERLRSMIRESSRIAFLGGAGVSTQSGIPDFRSEKGIFAAIEQYGYPPEVLLSHEFFIDRTDMFYRYYRDMLLYPDAQPNPAHFALAALERQGKLTPLSRRISTVCTSARAVKMYWSCMAACIGTSA